jgi:formylglycine-generating enzyme required for sulfatase activity
MRWIPGGTFRMGSADFYPEERPVHRVSLDGFWMDEHAVTVAEFRRFVAATRYLTVAERPPDPAAYPGADPSLLVPGSLVFHATAGPVDLRDYRNWWAYVPGANWRKPAGPGSGIRGRDTHPVTHVAYPDALAYAEWAGKDLPTEAEWEYAARGGLDGACYPWGDEFMPAGMFLANTWQGEFPWQNTLLDGYEGTSPAGAFPANGYGLVDMVGNVWEWTCDRFVPRHLPDPARTSAGDPAGTCCAPHNPRTGTADQATGQWRDIEGSRRVIKGGSHLCAPNYCLRYRPAARQSETADTATCHIGFRCVIRPTSPFATGGAAQAAP